MDVFMIMKGQEVTLILCVVILVAKGGGAFQEIQLVCGGDLECGMVRCQASSGVCAEW
jgi:hypothetical protein